MTIIQEGLFAARGILAVIMGQRDAPHYFDLSLRGLAGSAVAFLLALTLSAFLPSILGTEASAAMPAWKSAVTTLVVFGAQIGAAYIVLQRLGRLDGLVPYLVADNWTTFFVTVLSMALGTAGLDASALLVFFGILTIVIEVNIARLIVTLAPMQIVGFLVVQMVFAFAAILLLAGSGFLPIEAV